MKNIVIDINIFMDFLFKREGHEKAVELFKFCIKGTLQGLVCAHEITTLSYFLNKSIREKDKIKKTISGIMRRFKVIEINEEILRQSLYSEIDDYEDAVIEVAANINSAEYILTKNIKDFKKSIIKAITPEEFLVILKNDTEKPEKK